MPAGTVKPGFLKILDGSIRRRGASRMLRNRYCGAVLLRRQPRRASYSACAPLNPLSVGGLTIVNWTAGLWQGLFPKRRHDPDGRQLCRLIAVGCVLLPFCADAQVGGTPTQNSVAKSTVDSLPFGCVCISRAALSPTKFL